jgi:LacI family gluconate utilization system Gnt-I transcriptional repressor
MNDSHRPTLRTVADLSGVSVISVSRVMRGAPNISPALREKVLAAAEALGYRPNRVAGSLRARATNLVAVIVPSMSNSVFPEVIDGIDHGLLGTPYRTVLGITHYDQAREETILHDLLSWNPAAVIIAGLEHSERVGAMLRACAGPVVEVMDVDGEPIDLCVGTSQAQAGQLIARHFIETGRRRIGYVGAWGERPDRSHKRRIAFEKALAEGGIGLSARHIEAAPSSLDTGRRGCAAILADNPNLDAIFFANDDLALGALVHCRKHGIPVPGVLALAGFNGLDIIEAVSPRLTTIVNPRFAMGELASHMLLDRINGKDGNDPRRIIRMDLTLRRGETS